MRELNSDLQTASNDLQSAWQEFSEKIKKFRGPEMYAFQLDETEPQDLLSFHDVAEKIALVREYVSAMLSSRSFRLIPMPSIKRIVASLQEIVPTIRDANSKFDQFENAGVGPIDEGQLIISSADGSIRLELGALWRGLFEKLDGVITELSVVSHFFKVEGSSGYYTRQQEISRLVRESERDAQKVEITKERLTESLELQKALVKQIKDDVDYIDDAKTSVDESKAALDSEIAALQAKVQQTDASVTSAATVIERAGQLKVEIEAHKTFIEQNKRALQDLQGEIDKHNAIISDIEARIAKDQETIERQISDAEKMLKGATIAGLAGEFGTIRNELDTKLDRARGAVHLSVFFLFVSVAPILLYVFGPSFGIKTNGAAFGDGGLAQALTGIGMRSVLLIPSTWFARFSARRYDRIFKLKEHYAYKYSLATAVEGFKKQAPSYEDDIAAETFFELTFNPADKLDAKVSQAVPKRRESLVLKKIKERMRSHEDQSPKD